MVSYLFFFFKRKTAYEMRISDWSSDVCSSDLLERPRAGVGDGKALVGDRRDDPSLIILLALTQARARAHAVGEAAAVDRPVGGQFGHRRETDRAALPHATARGDEIGVLAQRVAAAPRRRGIEIGRAHV